MSPQKLSILFDGIQLHPYQIVAQKESCDKAYCHIEKIIKGNGKILHNKAGNTELNGHNQHKERHSLCTVQYDCAEGQKDNTN